MESDVLQRLIWAWLSVGECSGVFNPSPGAARARNADGAPFPAQFLIQKNSDLFPDVEAAFGH